MPPKTRTKGKPPAAKKETAGERMSRLEKVLEELVQAVKTKSGAALNTSVQVTQVVIEDNLTLEEEQKKLAASEEEKKKQEEEKRKQEEEIAKRLQEEKKRALEESGKELDPPPKRIPSAAAGGPSQLEGGVDTGSVALALNQMLGAGGEETGEIPNSYFVAGTTVDIKIKKKIWAREFVELGSLMNKPEVGSSVNMSYAPGSNSHLSFTPAKPRQPNNIYEWVQMFVTYAAIYCQKYPSESPQLLTYILRVMGITKSHPSSYIWRIYDERFRRLKQYSLSLPWHLLDHHVLHEA